MIMNCNLEPSIFVGEIKQLGIYESFNRLCSNMEKVDRQLGKEVLLMQCACK